MPASFPSPAGVAALRRQSHLPMVTADEQGLITEVNPRFREVLGWEPEELVGRPLTAIIPERFRDAHHLGFSRFVQTGVPTLMDRPVTLSVVTREGEELRAEHVITAERVQGRWIFAATIRPLSEREPAGAT